MSARVDVAEKMGNEKFLHLLVGGERILARVDPDMRAGPGQQIDMAVDV